MKRKLLSLALSLALCVSMLNGVTLGKTVTRDENNTEELTYVLYENDITDEAILPEIEETASQVDLDTVKNEQPVFMLKGAEFYYQMEPIEHESQLDYTLNISEISYCNGKIEIKGIAQDATANEYPIEIKAIPYQTENLLLQSKGGVTAISTESNVEVVNISFVREAMSEFLSFPTSTTLNGKSVATIVIMLPSSDKQICFEGELPTTFDYSKMSEELICASENKDSESIQRLQELEISTTLDDEKLENQVVGEIENWKISQEMIDDLPVIDADEYFANKKEKPGFGMVTMAAPVVRESYSRVPVDAFKKTGAWQSVNNPDTPNIGYFIITTLSHSNPKDRVSVLISWRYVYPDAFNIYVAPKPNTGSSGEKAAKLEIIDQGEYFYSSKTNEIRRTYNTSSYRLKNGAVATALQSNSEIFSYAKPTARINKNWWEVDWKYYIGLVSPTVGKAIDILNKVSYRSTTVGEKDYQLEQTIAKQISSYGNVVRGLKSAAGDGTLKFRDDHLTVSYVIHHPSDRTKVAGQHAISNRYYFELLYNGGLKLRVNQERTAYYYVS